MANRVTKGIIWTTLSSILRNVVSLLQIAILTRFLLKEEFGIIAIANMFLAFTTMFLDMGMAAGIIHKQNITKEEYSSIFWLNVLFGIGLTSLLYFIAPLLTAGYDSNDLTIIVRLICFTILLNSLGMLSRTYSTKKAMFKRLAIIECVGSIVVFIVALSSAMRGYGAYSLAYSTIAGALVINVIYLFIAWFKDHQVSFHFSFNETLPFLKIGIYQVGSSILDFFTRELDIIIVSATLGLEFLGVYNIAKRIPTALYSFINPIVGRVFTPLLAEMNGNIIRLKGNYILISKALSWISFPMYLFLAAIAPTVISIVFGNDYLDGIPVMMIFCLKYSFNGVNGVCGALQTALGRTDIGFKWTIYLVISTAVVYFISASAGITPFLIGIILLVFINAIVCWAMQFKPMVKVSVREYASIYIRSFVISTFLASLIFFIYRESSLVYSVISLFVFIILYVLLIINSKDGNTIIDVLNRFNCNGRVIAFLDNIHFLHSKTDK